MTVHVVPGMLWVEIHKETGLMRPVAETQENSQSWQFENTLSFSFSLLLRQRFLWVQVNLQSSWSRGGNKNPRLKTNEYAAIGSKAPLRRLEPGSRQQPGGLPQWPSG